MNATEHVETEEAAKNVIPGRLVRFSQETTRVGAPGCCNVPGQPRVEMVREGDLLKAIDVICGCGQRMRLRCVYDSPS